MKSILVLTSILFSSYVNAAPGVGDMVRYKMTVTTAGFSQIMDQKIEVTSINISTGTFTTNTTVTFNGTLMSQSTENSDLNSATEAESTLDHCLEMPAGMASVETISVPAGVFKVCHIKFEQNGSKLDQYMGRVLFGLVKSITVDSANNTTTIFELAEVKKH